ncbi:MAG TPA: PLP-dependent aminotransferase family protein [Bryobacteraceae bacterium]|nr:PLP-dependent aminotransferase family protein [Bryobacteraceae bacterium]
MKQLKVLFLDRASPVSLQVQLTTQLKSKIQQGQLSTGDVLPSSRELAANLKISRNTVVCAYDRLVSEGYLESQERANVSVSETAPLLRSAAQGGQRQAQIRPLLPAPNRPPSPFRPCQPDVQLFPLAIWNRLRNRALRRSNRALLHYNSASTLGLCALRENLATYLRASRGVQCEWWQIAITTGSQQALFLLATLLLKPNDKVYMENPGYLGAVRAWQAAGAEIHPLPVDANGIAVPPLQSDPASIVYVTPSRQFPTGASLSLHRRLALVNSAAATKAWIIEDDYDSEFRYDAPPLPSLQSLDGGNRVIYVGTFSKLLFPSLRLGYAVLPKELVEPFANLKSVAEDHGPMIEQATLAEFLDSGAFYSHIRRCRRTYAERQSAFLDCILKTDLPLEFRYRDGGMNLTGFLPKGFDDEACSQRLRQAGLDIPSLFSYASRPCEPGLVFGFTAFTPAEIQSAIGRMVRVGLGRARKRAGPSI